jgi:hypothetical protein
VNFFPDGFDNGTPYRVEYELTGTASTPFSAVGRASYPDFGSQAELLGLYPTTCMDFFAGANPTGRCFTLVENSLGGKGNIFDTFHFTEVALSEQDDGTMYWSYLQGTLATAFCYMERGEALTSVGDAALPRTHRALQLIDPELPAFLLPAPPGNDIPTEPPVFVSDISLNAEGRWEGNATVYGGQYEDHGINLGSSFSIVLDLPRTCHKFMLSQQCGAISFNGRAATVQVAGINVRCMPQNIGLNPVSAQGQCYAMEIFLPSEEPFTTPSNPQPKIFYTLSEQADGSKVWSQQAGPLVVSQGLLTAVVI